MIPAYAEARRMGELHETVDRLITTLETVRIEQRRCADELARAVQVLQEANAALEARRALL